MEKVYVAIITASVSIFVAALSYLFSKLKERESDWRKKKLEMYHELFAAISGITGKDSTPESQKEFAKSCNTIGLIASLDVIRTLQAFQIASQPNSSLDHDECLTKLLLAVRNDLKLPLDQDKEFTYKLWESGA